MMGLAVKQIVVEEYEKSFGLHTDKRSPRSNTSKRCLVFSRLASLFID